MTQAKNYVKWCLKKAEKELKVNGKHRGLIKIKANEKLVKEHIEKAEHYLKATLYLKEGNFSDISASTLFYSIYHSLLAIISKFGYESKNQMCTFALIRHLSEENKIDLKLELIDKIAKLSNEQDETIVSFREKYQYGTEFELENKIFEENLKIAKEILEKAKIIIF